jgi:uncharacterized protein
MANSTGTQGTAGRGRSEGGGNGGGNHGGNRGGGQDGDRQADQQGDNPQGNRNRERGFAAMDAERQREIASMGGRAAHRQGTAHEFSSEEARAAGRRGGEAVSQNREHMAQIGALGGRASRGSGSERSVGTVVSQSSDTDRQEPMLDGFGESADRGTERMDNGSGRQGSSSRH